MHQRPGAPGPHTPHPASENRASPDNPRAGATRGLFSGLLGRLARPLDLTGADRVFGTTVGEITYWSPSDTLAIVYDGLGPTVPGPGLVRLGMVDTGLDDLADAGNRGSVRIDLAAEVNS